MRNSRNSDIDQTDKQRTRRLDADSGTVLHATRNRVDDEIARLKMIEISETHREDYDRMQRHRRKLLTGDYLIPRVTNGMGHIRLRIHKSSKAGSSRIPV